MGFPRSLFVLLAISIPSISAIEPSMECPGTDARTITIDSFYVTRDTNYPPEEPRLPVPQRTTFRFRIPDTAVTVDPARDEECYVDYHPGPGSWNENNRKIPEPSLGSMWCKGCTGRSIPPSRFGERGQKWGPRAQMTKTLKTAFENSEYYGSNYFSSWKHCFICIQTPIWTKSGCCNIDHLENIDWKFFQRHNGPEGWVLLTKVTSLGHITSSYTNLDQTSSESRPSTNFKISTKHQHFDET